MCASVLLEAEIFRIVLALPVEPKIIILSYYFTPSAGKAFCIYKMYSKQHLAKSQRTHDAMITSLLRQNEVVLM